MDNPLEPMPGPNVFEMHEVIQQAGKPEDSPEDSFPAFYNSPEDPGQYSPSMGIYMGIYTDIGGLNTVADLNTLIPGGMGTFTQFDFGSLDGFPSLDDGNITFSALGSGSQQGIYIDLGDGLEKIIDLNDTLDGKNLSSFLRGRESLSGGSVAFLATFTDGSQGIFRAEVVPEPSTILLLASGLAGLGFIRRHKFSHAKATRADLSIKKL